MTVSLDGYALNDAVFIRTFKLAKVPPFPLKDGARMEVVGLTASPRWHNWEVVADGRVRDSWMKTAAGHTWMFAKHDGPHWIQFVFLQSRAVHQVALSWESSAF